MTAELIAVGSELLRLGRRDGNGEWLADRLQRAGIRVSGRTLIGDEAEHIAGALRAALDRSRLVIVTGGLGPTADDKTREALARVSGSPLERDEAYVARLRAAFAERGLRFRPNQARQADRPRGAAWLTNPLGTAPGIDLAVPTGRVFALPGVPGEMRAMFENGVLPLLAATTGPSCARSTLKVAGRIESSVDDQLSDLYATPGIEVTVLTGQEGIEVHLAATGDDLAEARRRLAVVEDEMTRRLGPDLYAKDDRTLPQVVGELLIAAQATVATAESCTGGLVAGELSATPGSSAWFRGGLVAYDDELKQRLVGVRSETLAQHGAVSEAVAHELARGARERCAATYGLGITGIAGPSGATPGKPVGLVHVALCHPSGTDHWRVRLPGDRQLVRRRTVVLALDRLRRQLLASGAAGGEAGPAP